MAYDAYGRPQRGNGESGYFDPSDPTPEYLRHYPIDPRDNLPSPRHGESSNPRQRFSPPINDRMTSASERPEPAGHESVSPEVIAAITERIKREGTSTCWLLAPSLVNLLTAIASFRTFEANRQC
jgi:hypothetical protein